MKLFSNFSNLLNFLLRQGRDIPSVNFCERLDILRITRSRNGDGARTHRPKQQHLRLSDGIAVLSRDAGCDAGKYWFERPTVRRVAK